MKKLVIFLIALFSSILGGLVTAFILKHKLLDALNEHIRRKVTGERKAWTCFDDLHFKISERRFKRACQKILTPEELNNEKS